MKTFAKCFCGFVVGWLIYMVAMALTVYDGVLSLIFQPIIATLFSGFFVAASFCLGLALRLPKVRDVWSSVGWWAMLISATAIVAMLFHPQLGLQTEVVDPETKATIKTMSPSAAALCYFFAIFPIVNLPSRISNQLHRIAAAPPPSGVDL